MSAEDDQLATGGQADMSSAGACSKTKTNCYEERAENLFLQRGTSDIGGQTRRFHHEKLLRTRSKSQIVILENYCERPHSSCESVAMFPLLHQIYEKGNNNV